MTLQEMKKHLDVLGIHEDIADVTYKYVNSTFRKLAKEIHPDKATDESTAPFQELLN